MKANLPKNRIFPSCIFAASLSAIPHADGVTPSPPPPAAEAPWRAETVVEGIKHPWGLTWLPDGRPLITAKAGTLHVVNDGKLEEIELEGQHFGSRLLWLPDGTLLMSVGDGGNPPQHVDGMLARDQAQNKGSHLGSILRLTDEGKPAGDNPFAGEEGALPELWTIGNRNIQGLARDPASGRVWANEHGPKGGDELNLISRGNNYGWPLHTFGKDYRTGEDIGSPDVPETVMPIIAWTPAHAPSGLAFYTGGAFPEWRGSVFSGGLISKDIRRIVLATEGRVTGQERLEIDGRVRDVRQGPDGYLYAITDEENGSLIRIVRR